MAGVKKSSKTAEAEEMEKTVENTAESEKDDSGASGRGTGAEETVTLAYIGPSLPAGQLKTNRVMIGTMQEIRKELAVVLEKYPLVEKLLVPVGKLAEKKAKAGTAGNILNKYYSDIVSSIAANEAAKEG